MNMIAPYPGSVLYLKVKGEGIFIIYLENVKFNDYYYETEGEGQN